MFLMAMKYIVEKQLRFPRFLKRKNTAKEKHFSSAYGLNGVDARDGIIRLPSNTIKSAKCTIGLFARDTMVKVVNNDNQRFTVLRAVGGSGQYHLRGNSCAIGYDDRLRLGLCEETAKHCNLVITPANKLEAEYHYCFLNPSRSSRQAQRLAWGMHSMGVWLTLLTFILGVF